MKKWIKRAGALVGALMVLWIILLALPFTRRAMAQSSYRDVFIPAPFRLVFGGGSSPNDPVLQAGPNGTLLLNGTAIGSGGGITYTGQTQAFPNVGSVVASPACPVSGSTLCNFVNADGHFVIDATTTNTSGVITCPSNDCNFTSLDAYGRQIAQNGQICFATSNAFGGGTLVIGQGTLTVNSAQQITCSATANANLTGTATLIWGSDDTANLLAFGTNVGCNLGVLPSGYMLTTKALFLTTTAQCLATANTIYTSASYIGQGFAHTWLIPTPNFDATTCTGGASNDSCFFGTNDYEVDELTIWGGGNPRTNSGTTHRIMVLGKATRGYNLNVTGWGFAEGNWYGLSMQGGQDIFQLSGVEWAGGLASVEISAPNPVTLYANFMVGSKSGIILQTTSSAIEINNIVNALGSAPNIISGTGFFSSYGDIIAGGTGHQVECFGTCEFRDSVVTASTAGKFAAFTQGAGSRITAENTAFTGTAGGGGPISIAASTSYIDGCGNTYITGTSVISGTVSGSCSSGGTLLTAGGVVLSANWGTSAAVSAPLGDAHKFQFTVTNGTAAVGASPTITITYPVTASTPFLAVPVCSLWQVGGTQAVTATTAILPPTSPTVTSVVFTYPATPTINLTEIYQGQCGP